MMDICEGAYRVPSLLRGLPMAIFIMSIKNFLIFPKVLWGNRIFNGDKKHTLVDSFTVGYIYYAVFTYRGRYLVPKSRDR